MSSWIAKNTLELDNSHVETCFSFITIVFFSIAGVSKFCNFTFEPLGRSCNDLEEHHKISVGEYIWSKSTLALSAQD